MYQHSELPVLFDNKAGGGCSGGKDYIARKRGEGNIAGMEEKTRTMIEIPRTSHAVLFSRAVNPWILVRYKARRASQKHAAGH